MHPNPTIKPFSQSVKSANQSVKSAELGSVSFADDVVCVSVVPYSEIDGFLPKGFVATADGWKRVSAHAYHWNGKFGDVLKLRLQHRTTHHDRETIDTFRRTMLRTCNAQMHDDV